MNETGGFGCLGHSNWTICRPFIFCDISICFTFILGGHFLLPQRANTEKRENVNSRTEWDRGFLVPGTFKLNHLHPFKPILFWQFSICCTFILGDHLLLPQRAITEKREISQFQNWIRQRGLGALGIQTGPFADLSAHFVLWNFNLFHLYTGRPFLITPKG